MPPRAATLGPLIPAVIRRSVLATMLIALAMGLMAVPAFGSGQQVLADYEDNGQIDGCYTLADFEDALKRIRPDQQQYGAAVDVIRQAELTNIRRPGGACGGTSASGASSDVPGGTSTAGSAADDGQDAPPPNLEEDTLPPVLIAVLVAVALALVGFVAYLIISRRGRGAGNGDGGDPTS